MIRRLHTKYINSKLGRKKASTQWVYLIALALVFWFGISMALRRAPKIVADEPGPMKVTVETLSSKNIVSDVAVYGQTEASERVTLRARTPGIVERIASRKGTRLGKGGAILHFRMEDREANFKRAGIEFATAKSLLEANLISKVEYVAAEAAYRSAAEAYDQMVLRAPFDGVVSDLLPEIGQHVAANENIGLFLKLDPIKIKAELPEKYIGRVRPGGVATVALSNGRTVEAALAYISSSANQATRTFSVELEAPNGNGSIVEGLTAEIRLPLDIIPATKLTVSSCLTFGDDGSIGVKAVDGRGVVRFYPVDLVREEKDGLWVSGLPATADVIVLGQEFVKTGEKVEPRFAAAGEEI